MKPPAPLITMSGMDALREPQRERADGQSRVGVTGGRDGRAVAYEQIPNAEGAAVLVHDARLRRRRHAAGAAVMRGGLETFRPVVEHLGARRDRRERVEQASDRVTGGAQEVIAEPPVARRPA